MTSSKKQSIDNEAFELKERLKALLETLKTKVAEKESDGSTTDDEICVKTTDLMQKLIEERNDSCLKVMLRHSYIAGQYCFATFSALEIMGLVEINKDFMQSLKHISKQIQKAYEEAE